MAKVKLLDPTDTRRRLDRYELIGEIASGGMATVFLARLAGVGGFQRFVAIKRLHPHLADDQEFVEMFLDEARLAAGIHHPHVVPILEVGTSASGYYLVMEYIEGDTLARIVARALSSGNGMPRPVLLRVVLDTLAGLHAAHETTDASGELVELVHRDCSPQNILVGVDGCSRITDFGVARATARLSTTRADRLKGKLAYMSPEQARGQSDIDRRADVFSMGTVLWEVLAGRRLFKAENEAATLTRVLMDPIPRLADVAPDVPAVFDEVCSKALDRVVAKRFQTAADMADALERAARSAALSTPSETGLASPREVASYVQAALGQEIAAQRESVRAWLSQTSEPSMTERGKLPYDRTIKMSIDEGAVGSAPSIDIAPSLTLVDVMADSAPPETLRGVGKAPPPASRGPASSPKIPAPPGEARVSVKPDSVPSSGSRTMVGVGPLGAAPAPASTRGTAGTTPRADGPLYPATNPTTLVSAGAAAQSLPGAPKNGVAVRELEEDEGETQLMVRDERIKSSPPPRMGSDETTPVSKAPDTASAGIKKSSLAPYFAVVAGLLVLVGVYVAYTRYATNAGPREPAPAAEAPSAPKTAATEPPPAKTDAPAATPAPLEDAEPTSEPARPEKRKGGGTPARGGGGRPRGRPAAEPKGEKPAGDSDLANPYR